MADSPASPGPATAPAGGEPSSGGAPGGAGRRSAPGGATAGAPGPTGADPGATTGGAAGGTTGGAGEPAPGLLGQLRATKDAVLGVLRAHIALGRAEAEGIKEEVAYAAAFAGIAFAALLLLGVFLPIVTMLFLGEWLFGSIGWGVLLGTELLLTVAAAAVVTGLKLEGVLRPAAVAAVIGGIIAFLVFGASWFDRLWTWIGDNTNIAIDSAYRPLAIAIVIVALIGALIGLIAGARAAGLGGAIGGLVGGLVLGGLYGAFLAYDFGWRVGAALGFATAYATFLVTLGARIAAVGIDTEAIKLRFWPQQTIETTRETIEWAKARNPLGPKS